MRTTRIIEYLEYSCMNVKATMQPTHLSKCFDSFDFAGELVVQINDWLVFVGQVAVVALRRARKKLAEENTDPCFGRRSKQVKSVHGDGVTRSSFR